MSKKSTRILTLVLVVLMLLSVTACGGGTKPAPASTAAATAAASTAAAATAPAASTPAATKAAEPTRISFVSPNWEDAPDFKNEWWSRMFKETNTIWDVNFIPASDYATKYDLMLASGDLPDIIMSESANRPSTVKAVQNGVFWDLTPYLGDFSKYPNLKKNPTPNVFKHATYDGKIYAIPRSRPQLDEAISIRKDWMDKLGLKMPTTLDEFKTVLTAIVNGDPDGNGKNDTVGLVGWRYNLADTQTMLSNAFGVYSLKPDADGGLIAPEIKNEAADYVGYLNELYKAGCISKEYSVMTITQAEDLITSGSAAAYGYNIWRTYDYSQRTKPKQKDAEFIVIPPMKGPNGTTAFIGKGVYGFFHISKQKVKEDKLLKILDFYELTCSPYWIDKGYYGWEGVHYTVNAEGTKVMTDLGKKQIGTGVQQPLPMMANTWAKVVCPSAPKAYNDNQLKYTQVIMDTGNTAVFDVIFSATWTDTWPKVQKEYEANFVKAVVGQMSIDDFRAYLAKLRAMPEFKKAGKEFADSYKTIFGK